MRADEVARGAAREVTFPAHRDSLDAVMRDSLRPVAAGLGALFLLFTVGHALVLPESVPTLMIVSALATAAALLLLHLMLRRWSIPAAWAHPVGAGMAGLVLLNSLLHLYLTADPRQTTNVALLVIGIGCFFLSARWLALVVAASTVGWLGVALGEADTFDWLHYGFLLLTAMVLSALTYAVRVRTLVGRLRAETALRESSRNVVNILESISDSFFTLDGEWHFTYINRQAEQVLRQGRGELLGKNIWEEFPEAVGTIFFEQYHKALAERRAMSFEAFYPPVGGWFDVHVYPSADGLSIYFADITERKRAEEAARESERRYRDLIEHSLGLICAHDLAGRLLFVNPAAARALGYEPAELVGMSLAEVLAPSARQLFGAYLERIRQETTSSGLMRVVTRGGAERLWFYHNLRYEEDGRAPYVLGHAQDITDEKRAEAAARKAEEYRNLFRLANDPIIVFDPEGAVVLDVNERACETYGLPREQFIGRSLREMTPDTSEAEVRLNVLLAEGTLGEFEAVHQRADGTPVHILVSASLIEYQGRRAVLSINRDITHRKRAEQEREELLARERKARREAEEANRAKDEFLATLSHELRTPLTSIFGWVRLLRAGGLNEDAAARALEAVERNTRAQKRLIDDLLDVSRIIAGKLQLSAQQLTLGNVVEVALDAVRPAAAAKGIELRTVLSAKTDLVSGDAQRLQQVVSNLLSNAVKFTPQGGSVEVRVERAGSSVQIKVSDTGQGIAPEFLPHVFDRFRQADASSTRRHGGLGLGLGIVRHLVELHGGKVWAESPGSGHGATFTVSLPRVSARAEPNAPERKQAMTANGASINCPPVLDELRVLVVEDDPDTREILTATLEQCGAEVTAVASAREALREIEYGTPAVLVSDLGLPETDGYALIERVRALPTEGGRIPAVAVTAYAGDEHRTRALRAGYQMHLAKPVAPEELVAAVASLARRDGEAD